MTITLTDINKLSEYCFVEDCPSSSRPFIPTSPFAISSFSATSDFYFGDGEFDRCCDVDNTRAHQWWVWVEFCCYLFEYFCGDISFKEEAIKFDLSVYRPCTNPIIPAQLDSRRWFRSVLIGALWRRRPSNCVRSMKVSPVLIWILICNLDNVLFKYSESSFSETQLVEVAPKNCRSSAVPRRSCELYIVVLWCLSPPLPFTIFISVHFWFLGNPYVYS